MPGIEFDVHLTSDGKLAVIHDHSTARVAAASLDVERSNWKELSALDIGSWKGRKWKGERIVELRELFEEFGESFYYDIELKSNISSDYGLEAAVAACLRDAFASKGGLTGRILVSLLQPDGACSFQIPVLRDTDGDHLVERRRRPRVPSSRRGPMDRQGRRAQTRQGQGHSHFLPPLEEAGTLPDTALDGGRQNRGRTASLPRMRGRDLE